jgi:hypothetical protein
MSQVPPKGRPYLLDGTNSHGDVIYLVRQVAMHGKSTRLRARDIRDVMRLVGDVRTCGHDPRGWRVFACRELCRLTDAFVGMSIQAFFTPQGPKVAEMVDNGWDDPQQQQVYYRWLGSPEFGTDPMMATLTRLGNTTFAWPRHQNIDDRSWYTAPTVSEIRRASCVDNCIISSVRLPGGAVDQIALHRRWGETRFGRRETVLVSLFHRELQRIWDADARHRAPVHGLPPYLRRTLEAILNGGSEKEAATSLGVTQSSLHSYVKQLHLRLHATSRFDLIERFGTRMSGPKLTEPISYVPPGEVSQRPMRPVANS